MAIIFDLNLTDSGDVGSLAWIDLGLIPTGLRLWLGFAQYTSPDKSIAFELRTNLSGLSSGDDASTKLLSSSSVTPKSGTKTNDMYRKGRLHITTVYGTGVEKMWLKLKSKSGSQGSYLYSINYTTE